MNTINKKYRGEDNIILEKNTLPILKNEKLLKKNKLLSIKNIEKNFDLVKNEIHSTITSNSYEDYARIQFKDILSKAICKDASDIHIEPFEDEVIIRFRVDGELSKMLTIAIESYSFLITVIKLARPGPWRWRTRPGWRWTAAGRRCRRPGSNGARPPSPGALRPRTGRGVLCGWPGRCRCRAEPDRWPRSGSSSSWR